MNGKPSQRVALVRTDGISYRTVKDFGSTTRYGFQSCLLESEQSLLDAKATLLDHIGNLDSSEGLDGHLRHQLLDLCNHIYIIIEGVGGVYTADYMYLCGSAVVSLANVIQRENRNKARLH